VPTKAEWRRRMRLELRSHAAGRRSRDEAATAQFLDALVAECASRSVAAYAAVAFELSLDAWLGRAFGQGLRLGVPTFSGGRPLLRELESMDRLSDRGRGYREPPDDAPELGLEEFDLVLVPGLAFDLAGGRLGRGAGFYDRLLTDRPSSVRLVGVGFDFQLVERLPREPHDVRLDGVLQPSGYRPCVAD